MRRAVAQALVLAGTMWAAGCGVRSGGASLYPELVEYEGLEVSDVDFENAAPFGGDTLSALVTTEPTRCNLLGLPFCIPFTDVGRQVHRLNLSRLAADASRLALFYRTEGYFGTAVQPHVDSVSGGVEVRFEIRRGDPVVLDSLGIEGLDGVLDADSLRAELPSQPGDVFHLVRFTESADQVLRALQELGRPHAQVLRNFSVDTARDRAEATLLVIPGPQVAVDSIVVRGADELGRAGAVRQLTFREGDLLRVTELLESQRNLYALDLVQFASVSLAPDSLQATPGDSTRATVIVQISEAPVHQVDAAAGFGTVDCFRADASWLSRSFGHSARRLALGASVSKLGIGAGLGGSLCSAFESDTLRDRLDYRATAELTQPYFLGPLNSVTLGVFAERISEPGVFQREAQGGGLAVTRRLGLRSAVTLSFDLERGTTFASPVLFCAAFLVCLPEDIDRLTQPRYRNSLTLSAFRNRTDNPLDPSSGYTLSSAIEWAPPWLFSDVTFVRWTGEGSVYRRLAPNVVGALSLRLGNFFQTARLAGEADFLPPEERFYAGGAATVRGVSRNALGPGIYVAPVATRDTLTGDVTADTTRARFVPTGGTTRLVTNAELRFPSPWRSDVLGLAAFVDAGIIGTGHLWEAGTDGLTITPGIGLRITTPVGPVRIDLAYGPARTQPGPLYVSDAETGRLVRVRDVFQRPEDSFWRRLQLHLAVGQAF